MSKYEANAVLTDIQGKAVLITGCSSGIGKAAAFGLQNRGYQVIASCRHKKDVETLLSEGIKHCVQLDLNNSQSIKEGLSQCLDLCDGKLYALFNNGAYGLPGALEDVSRKALREQFETNVFGTHELTSMALPTLIQQPSARIVQNSSILGFVAMPNRGAYNASKFALEGLTDTLRLELSDTKVKVSLIEPGPIVSEFRQNALAKFEAEIDIQNSRHKVMYEAAVSRLKSVGPTMKFTLPPEAVVNKLVHALESPRPKIRYRVTTPTYVMAYLKRLLSSRALDATLLKVGKP